jgi:hypothetical protein
MEIECSLGHALKGLGQRDRAVELLGAAEACALPDSRAWSSAHVSS